MDKFRHKKKYGQNFLKSKNVLVNIIDSIEVDSDDLIIEIGPGQGALTKYLKLFNANIVCYEIDTDLKKYLSLLEDDKTKIIFEDFLKADIEKDIKGIEYKNLYIVANLPYYITTPIIEKIIDSKIDVKECLFMVQKEVADRLSAKEGSKDYGYITVYLSYYFDVTKLFKVDRKLFNPVPNVDSAIIKLVRKDNKKDIDINTFNKLIKSAFLMKRKNLKNNLKNYNLEVIEKVLNNYNLTLQNRAEEVPLECFIDISESM